MLKIISIFFTTLLFAACGQNQPKRAINDTDFVAIDTLAIINNPTNNVSVQTNSFSEIDSSGIIMFPLSIGSNGRDGGSFSYSGVPYNTNWNIIFYNSHTSQYYLLSDRKMLISSIDIQTSSNDQADIAFTKRNIFYKVSVDDYNKDKKLNTEDPEYLFVSDKQGRNFKQISPSGYNMKSWQYIRSTNKIIMTVTKDANNDKSFGGNNEVCSFQINIDTETQPTEMFSTDFKTS